MELGSVVYGFPTAMAAAAAGCHYGPTITTKPTMLRMLKCMASVFNIVVSFEPSAKAFEIMNSNLSIS